MGNAKLRKYWGDSLDRTELVLILCGWFPESEAKQVRILPTLLISCFLFQRITYEYRKDKTIGHTKSKGYSMTDSQVTQLQQRVKVLSEAEGTILLSCSVYPHVISRKITSKKSHSYLMGHYFSFKKGTPLFFEPSFECQFVGVHDCLCMTIRRPMQCKDMLGIASRVREIPPFGNIAWLGAVAVRTYQKHSRAVGRIYVPTSVWTPPKRIIGKRIRVNALIHEVKTGLSPFKLKVMEFPAFQRNEILDQYIVPQ